MKKILIYLVVTAVCVCSVAITYMLFITQANLHVDENFGEVTKDLKNLYFIHWGYFPKEIFNNFSKKYPDISVKFEKIDEENYDNQQKIRIASGNQVDVMGVSKNLYEDFVRRGYLVDLTGSSYLDNYKAEVRYSVKSLLNHKKEYAVAYKSEVYGIWYNKILFDKYDIDIPDNYKDFLAVCSKLKSNGISPMVLGARDDFASSYIFLLRLLKVTENDKNWYDNIRSGKLKWTDTQIKSVFDDIGEFISNGYLREDSISLTYHQAFSEFTNGRAAMIIMGDGSINLIKDDIEKVCDPDVMLIPYNDSNWTAMAPGNKADYLTGIFSESKNKKEADLFLEYLSTPEAAQIYSDMTMSMSTVKGVDVSGLMYNRVWEPVRKTELISPGITDMDYEMRRQFNKGAKELIAKTKTVPQVVEELQAFQGRESGGDG